MATYNLKVTAKYTGASYVNIYELLFTVIVDVNTQDDTDTVNIQDETDSNKAN